MEPQEEKTPQGGRINQQALDTALLCMYYDIDLAYLLMQVLLHHPDVTVGEAFAKHLRDRMIDSKDWQDVMDDLFDGSEDPSDEPVEVTYKRWKENLWKN